MADQDAIVVVVQVVPPEHVQLPPHRRHDVVHSPLQHGTAGQPLVLRGDGGSGEAIEANKQERGEETVWRRKRREILQEGGREKPRGRGGKRREKRMNRKINI